MLRHVTREALTTKWSELRTRAAIPGAIALALSLSVGLIFNHPAWGMIMAGGALSVGFGAFQAVGRSRLTPMLGAAVGISISGLLGSAGSQTAPGLLIVAVVAGFFCGLSTALGPGVGWIGLQCAIAAIVASGYPSELVPAFHRALLILAGGVLQVATVILFRQLHTHFTSPVAEDPYEGMGPALGVLRANLRWSAAPFRFGVHLALTLAAAALCAHLFSLSNGYWVPMTAVLVLKPDVHQTFGRGLSRVLGTLFGAGVATLLTSWLHPSPFILTLFVALFAWLCFSLAPVNYGIFSACVTAYIAFLLAFTGRPTKETAIHRIANTALGGTVAMLAYAPGLLRNRRETAAPDVSV